MIFIYYASIVIILKPFYVKHHELALCIKCALPKNAIVKSAEESQDLNCTLTLKEFWLTFVWVQSLHTLLLL